MNKYLEKIASRLGSIAKTIKSNPKASALMGVGVTGSVANTIMMRKRKKELHRGRVYDYKGKRVHSADLKYFPHEELQHLKHHSYADEYKGRYDFPYGPNRDKVFRWKKK